MNELYKELGNLVSIPSITRSKEEKEIVKYIDTLLKSILSNVKNQSGVNINIETIEEEDKNGIFHGGIVCNIHISNDFKTVGLLGHLDVVPVSSVNWTKPPFKITEENDRVFGRGVCDMKAGVVIMIESLKKALEKKPNKNISLIFTSGEECGIPNGLTEIIKSNKVGGLDFVIALEPTGGKINTGVFGYLDGEFTFKGKSCHSSKPKLGENAIHKAWKLINYLNNPDIIGSITYYGEKLEEALSATEIKGGIASNVVPDICTLKINHRYSPEKKGIEVEKGFNDLSKKVGADFFKVIEHNSSSDIVVIDNPMLLDFINKIKGNSEILSVVPFWSDISQTSGIGIPSVNFGPGNIEQAHTDDEFLLKKSFEKTYKQFINYLFY